MTTNFTNANDITIEGFGTVQSGTYKKIMIEGCVDINDGVSFDHMIVEGTCNAKGDLKGNNLEIEGIVTANVDIRVRELEIEGVLTMKSKKLYADKLVVEGVLENQDEVNADQVIIEGCVNLNDLFGDNIIINAAARRMLGFIFNGKKLAKINSINTIECTTLKASNITCKSICATDIWLSKHCNVEVITCDGTLHYDSTCVIGRIEGECDRVKE